MWRVCEISDARIGGFHRNSEVEPSVCSINIKTWRCAWQGWKRLTAHAVPLFPLHFGLQTVAHVCEALLSSFLSLKLKTQLNCLKPNRLSQTVAHLRMVTVMDLQLHHIAQTGLENTGGPSHEGPPLKNQMWPQRAVAGGGTSKSGGGTSKGIHLILSSNFLQGLQFLWRYRALPAHTSNFHLADISRFPILSVKFLRVWFISLYFFQFDFFYSGRMAKCLPGQSEL